MQITLHHWIKREKQLYWQSRRWLTASTIVTVISLSSFLTDLAFSLMSLFFIFSEISVQREPLLECCYLFIYSYLPFFVVCVLPFKDPLFSNWSSGPLVDEYLLILRLLSHIIIIIIALYGIFLLLFFIFYVLKVSDPQFVIISDLHCCLLRCFELIFRILRLIENIINNFAFI